MWVYRCQQHPDVFLPEGCECVHVCLYVCVHVYMCACAWGLMDPVGGGACEMFQGILGSLWNPGVVGAEKRLG